MDSHSQKNLQDILKFAISHQSDGANVNESTELDEDKMSFLNNVLSLMSVNALEELSRAMRILDNTQSSDQDKCDALEFLREFADTRDFASNFIRAGGAEILLKYIKSDNIAIKENCINTIAEMVQNDPFSQKYFLDCGIIKSLDFHLTNDFDDRVVTSALYGLFSMVNNFEPALVEFQNINGIEHIVNCLNRECERVITKASFLISNISTEFCSVRDEFCRLRAFDMLSKHLKMINGYDTKIELVLEAMVKLISSSTCDPDAEIKKTVSELLRDIIVKNEHLPQCKEIILHAKALLDAFENVKEVSKN